MAEYVVAIEGKYDLAQIELQIRNEEAGFSEFLEMEIGRYRGRDVNLATFVELAPGKTPNVLTLSKVSPGTPATPGIARVWEGELLEKGVRINVAVDRRP